MGFIRRTKVGVIRDFGSWILGVKEIEVTKLQALK